jgi:hypothetical protein
VDGVVAEARGSMQVTYHQFWLLDTGQRPRPSIRPDNGLVGAGAGAAIVSTGIHTGVVALSVQVRDRAPGPDDDLGGWDEVVDLSLAAPAGQVRPAALMSDTDPFPALTAAGPGDYRIRVHARGRDRNIDGVDEEPAEEYHIVVWPQAPEPELVHRQSDAYGGSMRRSVAAAPPVRERPADPRQAMIDEVLRRAQNRSR